MEIIEKTVMDAWKAGLVQIKECGREFVDGETREGKEILNLLVKIEESSDILLPIELLARIPSWVYPSPLELQEIIFSKRMIPTVQYTYGSRIFNFASHVDQVQEFIIPLLKANPLSRRAIISTFYPVSDSKVQNKEMPSLISIFFKIQEGKLEVTGILRSADFFIGWPTNIFQLCKLQEMVAEALGIPCGSMTTISHSAHCFKEYGSMIDEVLSQPK